MTVGTTARFVSPDAGRFGALGARLRVRYDALGSGSRAELRRCKTPDDVGAEGLFLSLASSSGVAQSDLDLAADLVWLFPKAAQCAPGGRSFQLGRYLRDEIFGDVKMGELPARARRFRQLVAARERAERLHHLWHLLGHAFQRNRHGVDWAVIAYDLGSFDDRTRRRLAESFFFRAEPVTDTNEESTDV